MARQAVASAQQQTGVLKARLTQAETIYERHMNLWKQNIGAEINVINAKADVDALQSQLRAAQAQVSMAQEQANMSNVTAEIGGTVDVVNVKVGEFFSPQSAAMPQSGIRIVNNSSLKVVANVPENYVRSVKKGFAVVVDVPQSDTSFNSVINAVGASIDPVTRSFNAEARVPSTSSLKPNQIATMKILDKKVMDAIKISVNLVQPDENGRYVYVVENNGGKLIARKRQVEVGEVYNGEVLIKNGLRAGDVIITEGYQTVYDGQSITTGK
jgi:RND family efflux transporter MFP subunit